MSSKYDNQFGSSPADGAISVPFTRGGEARLFNMDCYSGMEQIPDGSVSVVVTSPPYNLGIRYGQYDDTISRADYLDWIIKIFSRVKQKLEPDGSLFLNVGSSPTSPWGPFEIIAAIRPIYSLQNVIHWVKSIYVENESYGKKASMNVGHYKPINSTRFVNDTHEYVFHLTKTGSVPLDRLSVGVPYKDQGNVTRWKEGVKGVRCRGNCWYIPYKTIQSRTNERPHPASFPSELAEMCIRLQGGPGASMTVLDPFMGIGNTALACARVGVSCIGFEIDKEYYTASIRLLRENTGECQAPSNVS